jgi:hypothetical protein
MRNLPIIMLTGEDWDPVNVGFGNGRSRVGTSRNVDDLIFGNWCN